MIGYKTKLSVNDGSSHAQAVFINPTSVSISGRTTDMVETTAMDSTTPDKTYIGGMTDGGELQCEQIFNAADYARLLALEGKSKHDTRIPPTGTDVIWVVTLPGGTGAPTYTFNGILKDLDMKSETAGNITTTFNVKLSGPVTVGAAA